jgi:hypothetical protein
MATTLFPFDEFSEGQNPKMGDVALHQTERVATEAPKAGDVHSDIFLPFETTSEDEAEKERLYSEDDLAQAVEEAKRTTAADVEAAVRQLMLSEIEQRQCDLLEAIKGRLDAQNDAFDQELTAIADASQKLALAMVKAVIPLAIEQQPLSDIKHLVRDTLERLSTPLSIDIRVSPDLVESGRVLLSDVAGKAKFRGQIETLADPDLGAGDVTLSWRGGAVERRLDRIQREAIDLVHHWLPGITGEPVESDESNAAEVTSKAVASVDDETTNEQAKP